MGLLSHEIKRKRKWRGIRLYRTTTGFDIWTHLIPFPADSEPRPAALPSSVLEQVTRRISSGLATFLFGQPQAESQPQTEISLASPDETTRATLDHIISNTSGFGVGPLEYCGHARSYVYGRGQLWVPSFRFTSLLCSLSF